MSNLMMVTTYKVIDCFKCGALFALPEQVNDELVRSGRDFWCPNGHSQHYTESTVTLLKKEREKSARIQARLDQERAELAASERRASAARGQVTRIRNRIANGVCPCCNRTFVDLASHMKTKHPDYVLPTE